MEFIFFRHPQKAQASQHEAHSEAPLNLSVSYCRVTFQESPKLGPHDADNRQYIIVEITQGE